MMNTSQLKAPDISKQLYETDPLGTGCKTRKNADGDYDVLSCAIASHLAQGQSLEYAVEQAMADFHGQFQLPRSKQAILAALNSAVMPAVIAQQRAKIKRLHNALFPECYNLATDLIDTASSAEFSQSMSEASNWKAKRKLWAVSESLNSVDTYRHALDVYASIPWYEFDDYLSAIPEIIERLFGRGSCLNNEA